jgi:hypothetical protein
LDGVAAVGVFSSESCGECACEVSLLIFSLFSLGVVIVMNVTLEILRKQKRRTVWYGARALCVL